MYRQFATDEYIVALKLGLKEQRELIMAGKNPYPPVKH